MKILLLTVILSLMGCVNSDYLRKVQVLDEEGNPIKGVMRTPREKIFGKGEFSDRNGYLHVVTGGSILQKEGFIPLRIKKNSNKDTYIMSRNLTKKKWDALDPNAELPSQ